MSKVTLPLPLLEESYGTVQSLINSGPVAIIGEVAALVKSSDDDSVLLSEYLDICKVTQDQFNAWTDSQRGFLADFSQVIDLAEFDAKRATMGEVKREEVTFSNSGIDVSNAMH